MILPTYVFWPCVFWSLSHSCFLDITFAKIRFLSLSLTYINMFSHRNLTCNYGNIFTEHWNIGEIQKEILFFSKQTKKWMYFYSWYLLTFYYLPGYLIWWEYFQSMTFRTNTKWANQTHAKNIMCYLILQNYNLKSINQKIPHCLLIQKSH